MNELTITDELMPASNDAALTANQHEIRVLDRTGDSRYTWDKTNCQEVLLAEKMFEKFKKQGFLCYAMKDGSKGEVLQKFDPAQSSLIFTPPMAGG